MRKHDSPEKLSRGFLQSTYDDEGMVVIVVLGNVRAISPGEAHRIGSKLIKHAAQAQLIGKASLARELVAKP